MKWTFKDDATILKIKKELEALNKKIKLLQKKKQEVFKKYKITNSGYNIRIKKMKEVSKI